MFCRVRGYGRRRAWRTMVSPTRGTPLPFVPLHAWRVRCWPACVWSVYGRVVAAAAVWLVHGCVSSIMVGLFVVWSFLLLRALSRFGLNWGIRVKARASRRGLGLVVAGISDAGFGVLRPGCSRRVVFVRRRRSRTWSACRGFTLLPSLIWPAMRSSCMGVWLSCCRQRYVWPFLLPWRRVRRMMAGFSCCQVCWAIGGRLPLCGGVWPPSWWGLLWWCVAPLIVGRGVVLCGPPHGGACCGRVWSPSWWGCCSGVWSSARWDVV